MITRTPLPKAKVERQGSDAKQLTFFDGQMRQETSERRRQIHNAALALYLRNSLADKSPQPTYWWEK